MILALPLSVLLRRHIPRFLHPQQPLQRHAQEGYRTCLKRIEQHPHDIFAMNCAASLGGRVNLNRFGEYLFGNEAVVEKHTMLSGRDEQAAADGEEGDGEEGDGEE